MIALKKEKKDQRKRKHKDKQESEYIRPPVTLQDKISEDPNMIKEKLVGYDQINRDNYEYIKPGTFIRYLRYLEGNRVKYCHGGILIVNAAPAYWILSNNTPERRTVSWSVQLQNSNIYYCKSEQKNIPEQSVQQMCDMILSGEYRLIKTDLLLKLPPNILTKIVNNNNSMFDSDEDNSDEESSSMCSDEDSDEYRRPTTIVQLVK